MRKNISLDENIVKKAIKKAKKLGMTFSGYLLHLINKDLEVN